MMKNPYDDQSGFSAIELLITLFVAAAFISAGYQLYSTILKSGGQSQQSSSANNIAYNALRLYTPNATALCTESTPNATIPANSGLSAPSSIAVTITCPYGPTSSISKVNVRIQYGSPAQEVIHAIYVNGN